MLVWVLINPNAGSTPAADCIEAVYSSEEKLLEFWPDAVHVDAIDAYDELTVMTYKEEEVL